MDKTGPKYSIGISTQEKDFSHFRKYARKGFSYVGFTPDLNDVRSVIDSLKGKKTGCDAAVVLRCNGSVVEEEEIIKIISAAYSLLYDFADQFIIDISQQNSDYADEIIDALVEIRLSYDTYKPLSVHLSKEIGENSVDRVLNSCRMSGIDGVISQDYDVILKKVGNRYPVCAELAYANPRIVAEAINKGADSVIVQSYKPGCRFVKKCLKACEELS